MDEGENKGYYYDFVSSAGFREVFHFVPVIQIYLVGSSAPGGPSFMFLTYMDLQNITPYLYILLYVHFKRMKLKYWKEKALKGNVVNKVGCV
jgi:hypothetical protein